MLSIARVNFTGDLLSLKFGLNLAFKRGFSNDELIPFSSDPTVDVEIVGSRFCSTTLSSTFCLSTGFLSATFVASSFFFWISPTLLFPANEAK